MPYSRDMLVPTALLALMKARIGEKNTKALLHDYIEHSSDRLTEAAMMEAIGGKIDIETVITNSDNGYMPSSKITFESRINGETWSGQRLSVPPLPQSVASGLIGQPLSVLIHGDFYGNDKIAEVKDWGEETGIFLDQTYIPIKDIGIGFLTKATSKLRVMKRQRDAAKKLTAHYGFNIATISSSVFMGCVIALLTILTLLALGTAASDFGALEVSAFLDNFAPPIMLVCISVSMWFTQGLTKKDAAVSNYAKKIKEAVMRDGISVKKEAA